MWASNPGFVKYNFKEVDKIPKEHHHAFDYVVIDPPFITEEVWELYCQVRKIA
jgi:tRNA1(Val) A37 N6-methylase TrmN6